jgi:hypothetical protein
METRNEELLTPRDLRRELNRHLTRLEGREVDKLVLMKGNKVRAVVMRAEDYEKLTNGG